MIFFENYLFGLPGYINIFGGLHDCFFLLKIKFFVLCLCPATYSALGPKWRYSWSLYNIKRSATEIFGAQTDWLKWPTTYIMDSSPISYEMDSYPFWQSALRFWGLDADIYQWNWIKSLLSLFVLRALVHYIGSHQRSEGTSRWPASCCLSERSPNCSQRAHQPKQTRPK